MFIVGVLSFSTVNAQHSVAREWNEILLESIRNDFARPTVHARNLFHTSVAMYDAWAAYDDVAKPYLLGETNNGYTCPFDGVPVPADIEAAREEAISFATYRVLRHRFQYSPNAFFLLQTYNQYMNQLGYNTADTSTDYASGNPAALGNYIAYHVIQYGLQDGANETGFYENLYYEPFNAPLVTDLPGNPNFADPNRWQPLTLDIFIDQSGNPIPFNTPEFLSPEWGTVWPFALRGEDANVYNRDNFDYWVYHDPGMPPQLDPAAPDSVNEIYKWNFALVSVWSSHLDPTDGVMIDISPASIGNVQYYPETFEELPNFYNLINGGDTGIGHTMNPVTGMPYEPQVVPRADYGRVLAEFWADGPDSETPPGHWFTLLNYVNDHPLFEKRFRGEGEILNDLEWDVKAYFTMGGTMHDAAITAWGCKGWYDYPRPISAIRGMVERGQCTDNALDNYDPLGIPLIPGYIEIVDVGDPLAGVGDEHVGKIKLYAWRGPDYISAPETDVAGVGWILGENWWPFQRPSFVTPPFAGYVSGHSTYSRAAAEMMTLLTGDPFFPGGMGEFDAIANEFLVFEDGPTMNLTLQWATYRDASDQCSLSRIWGGIHPPADDMPGRLMGEKVGVDAFFNAERYFFKDEDNDGYFDFEDCNDMDASINPGAAEVCDGIDNDCNGELNNGLTIYTYYQDADMDGFGDAAVAIDTCAAMPPAGFVDNADDCNDANNMVNPNATEICDAIDNDCNGLINDGLTYYTYWLDTDMDSFGDENFPLDTCITFPPTGYVDNALDCNDNDNSIHPDAVEICDNIDNNCNGLLNDGLAYTVYYQDFDNDGYGNINATLDTCLAAPPGGYVTNTLDCNDNDAEINPDIAEVCDGIDNDCNGLIDDGLPLNTYYLDFDADTYGDAANTVDTCISYPPTGYVANALDFVDNDAEINPDAIEVCDGIDNNCNGLIDDGLPLNTYYLDADNDNYGDVANPLDTCLFDPPSGYVVDSTDCNDNDASINPDAPETADDGIDQDCSGIDLYELTKVFPNPVRDELYVHYNYQQDVTLVIVGMDGRLINEYSFVLTENYFNIDVSRLSPGVYSLRLLDKNEDSLLVEKFVKY